MTTVAEMRKLGLKMLKALTQDYKGTTGQRQDSNPVPPILSANDIQPPSFIKCLAPLTVCRNKP